MKKIDLISEIMLLQLELDIRTEIEKMAEKLIINCRFHEAIELLNNMDNSVKNRLGELING